MKAYKLTLLFVDHDDVGMDGAISLIENAQLPNHISAGTVMEAEDYDIGEWSDDHPLNSDRTMCTEFDRMFNNYGEI